MSFFFFNLTDYYIRTIVSINSCIKKYNTIKFVLGNIFHIFIYRNYCSGPDMKSAQTWNIIGHITKKKVENSNLFEFLYIHVRKTSLFKYIFVYIEVPLLNRDPTQAFWKRRNISRKGETFKFRHHLCNITPFYQQINRNCQ